MHLILSIIENLLKSIKLWHNAFLSLRIFTLNQLSYFRFIETNFLNLISHFWKGKHKQNKLVTAFLKHLTFRIQLLRSHFFSTQNFQNLFFHTILSSVPTKLLPHCFWDFLWSCKLWFWHFVDLTRTCQRKAFRQCLGFICLQVILKTFLDWKVKELPLSSYINRNNYVPECASNDNYFTTVSWANTN